jgi:hypothetical protein
VFFIVISAIGSGLRISPNTLYRDIQAVRAYATTKSSRLRNPAVTNSRPSTSSYEQSFRSRLPRFGTPDQLFQIESIEVEDEEEEPDTIMELRRQLAVTKQDLQFSKVRQSLIN